MQINCLIIDDEPLARKGLAQYIEDISFLNLIAQCESTMSADKALNQSKIDLIFLDIQMPKMTGVQFLKALKSPPKAILTTAYSEYALEGFELDVLDYLVKPIAFERFYKACLKAKEYFERILPSQSPTPTPNTPAHNFFFVKCEQIIEKINFNDILFVEALENYVLIHTIEKKHITYITFKAIQDFLPPTMFTKVHKSYIVSIPRVTAIDGAQLIIDRHKIPISRTLKQQIMEEILNGKYLKKS